MTTKETSQATTDAVPAAGEVLLYIDHTGAKLFGKPVGEKAPKKESKPE